MNTEDKDAITLSFAQVESILGFPLPKSAYTYNAWWANGGHSQAAAWMNVGYQVAGVDLRMKSVIFRKKSGTVKTAPPSNALSICGYPFSFSNTGNTATSVLDEDKLTELFDVFQVTRGRNYTNPMKKQSERSDLDVTISLKMSQTEE